jgi:hypothetical protein
VEVRPERVDTLCGRTIRVRFVLETNGLFVGFHETDSSAPHAGRADIPESSSSNLLNKAFDA